jgi:small-conductance mechanosensitive channel/CRP-like cAMP-binding protein
MPSSFSRQLIIALTLLGLAVSSLYVAESMSVSFAESAQLWAERVALSMIWLSTAHLVNVLVGGLFWDGLIARTLNRKPPRLIVQLTNLLVLLLALSGIVGIVFEQPITGLWATSGAVGLVVGLALRNLILDTFSGLAIHLEEPFKVGDWILVHTRFGKMAGRVEETNWRSTRLHAADSNIVVIPNSLITSAVVTNCSRPDTYSEFEHPLVLDFRVPVDRALRLIGSALRQTVEEHGVLAEPAPKVRVSNTSAEGIQYTISYYLRPTDRSLGAARDMLLRNVLSHLANAGVSLSYPRRDIFVAKMPWRQRDWHHSKDVVRQLARLSLFESLSPQELEQLANHVEVYSLGGGQIVVAQDDAGDSMFILAEGLLTVSVRQPDGSQLRVGDIAPGDFFGERSLLTGEPRSATVITAAECILAEINKAAIAELLHNNQGLVDAFSRALLERELHNGDALALSEQRQLQATVDAESGRFVRRLKTFFGI